MAIYNKRIQFTKENLLDSYLRRDSLPDIVYGIIRILGIVVQNIYCVSSYLVLSWILLFPISWFRSDLYSKAENYLYNSLLFIVSSWSMAAGINVVETGDEYKHLIEEPHNEEIALNDHESVRLKQQQIKSTKFDPQLTENLQAFIDNEVITKNPEEDSESNFIEGDLKVHTTTKSYAVCEKLSQEHPNANSNFNKQVNNNNNDASFEKTMSNSRHNVMPKYTKTNHAINNVLVRKDQLDVKISPRKPRILLLCNHISTADVPLIMQSLSTLTNQSLLWVLDAQFKPTNFGLVCSSHGDFFIAKNSFTDGSLRDQVLKHPDRNLLVLFPEGGFLRKRLEGSNRYAVRNGLPLTQYVTHPRFGAFKDLIDPSVGVTHIIDATLLYDDIKDPLSILNIALGNRKEPVILNYKVYKRSEINPTEEWLRKLWLDKDKLLQQYYQDRSKVYELLGGSMRTAKLDWFKVLSVHLFYLLACYLTIYRLFSATSVTMLKARDLYYSNI